MQRLICLDGLRGALAFYVMVSHMAPFAIVPPWLAAMLSHGGAAVDMFFILSGLVIVRSLGRFRWQARPFLIARVARIFPVYLATLVAAIAIQPLPIWFDAMPWVATDSPARSIWSQGWPSTWAAELLAHVTMTHGAFPAGVLTDVWVSFLGAAWSLSTEWQFYLLALLAGYIGKLRKIEGAGHEGPPIGALVALFTLLGAAGLAWHLAAPPEWQFSRAFLPNKAQYFALGIASSRVVDGGGSRTYAAALAGTLALAGWQHGAEKLLPPLAWTLCLTAQLRPDRAGLRELSSALRAAPMQRLGSLSYCLYLANEPIQKLLGVALAAIVHRDGWLFTVFWVPFALLLPLLASVWLHRAIEVPALSLGRNLAGRADRLKWSRIEQAARTP